MQRGLPSFYMGGPHETMTVNWAVHEQEETTWGSPDSSCYGVEKENYSILLLQHKVSYRQYVNEYRGGVPIKLHF